MSHGLFGGHVTPRPQVSDALPHQRSPNKTQDTDGRQEKIPKTIAAWTETKHHACSWAEGETNSERILPAFHTHSVNKRQEACKHRLQRTDQIKAPSAECRLGSKPRPPDRHAHSCSAPRPDKSWSTGSCFLKNHLGPRFALCYRK